MPSEAIFKLTNSDQTLTKAVAENPDKRIHSLISHLFKDAHGAGSKAAKKEIGKERRREDYTREDLDRAAQCGKFPSKPSDLFLMIYCDVLDTLERDPWVGMVSPPLLGSSGVIPLSIVSVIPDIMRHYRNLIANAQTEVMIATNYWETSFSSSLVHQALIELSQKHEGKEKKPVVKLIYDRGNPKQVIKNHQRIPPDEWEAVGLPKKEEIPNIEFEVMNYHRPIMGTFHAKYMVVDRKIACLNSNNIQDRVNVEMMTQLEGPIVDSFYDMALLSWAETLEPPFPLLSRSPNQEEDPTKNLDPEHPDPIAKQHVPPPDASDGEEVRNSDAELDAAKKLKGVARATADHLNAGMQHTDPTTSDDIAEGFHPHILHKPRKPFPIVMVNRPPHGTPGHSDLLVPQNVAWLAAFRLAQKNIFIQTPTFNASPVVPAIIDACRRGVDCTLYIDLGFNDGGELLPGQGGTNSKVVAEMYKALNAENKQQFLKVY
ncbi:hypothetical protein M422DRAFT_118388, partial [Sphaerobolus stellatus SS14]